MKPKWQTLSGRVQGASHKRKNVPCQDSLTIQAQDEAVIIAVADGHGGKNHFRSEKGSLFACEIAKSLSQTYVANVFSKEPPSLVEDVCSHKFKKELVALWRRRVWDDLEQSPLSPDERTALNISCENYDTIIKKDRGEEADGPENAHYYKLLSVYGTTLLLTIILKDVLLFWQLGDGDILLYYKEDERVFSPMPADERLIANETTSMCQADAVSDMRFAKLYTRDPKNEPDLLLMATDGYANSFANAADFEKVLADYYGMLSNNPRDVSENITNWLDETSAEGSGDDISLVLSWKRNVP